MSSPPETEPHPSHHHPRPYGDEGPFSPKPTHESLAGVPFLFPFDGGGWFGGNVVDDAVDAWHLVDDTIGDAAQ